MTLFVQDPEGLKKKIASSMSFGGAFPSTTRQALRDAARYPSRNQGTPSMTVIEKITNIILANITPAVLNNGDRWQVTYINQSPARYTNDVGTVEIDGTTYYLNQGPHRDAGYVELDLTGVRNHVKEQDPRPEATADAIQALLGEDFDYALNVIGDTAFLQYRPKAELLAGLNPLIVSLATTTMQVQMQRGATGMGLATLTNEPFDFTIVDFTFQARREIDVNSTEGLAGLSATAIITAAKAQARAELVARIRGRNRIDPKVVAEEERKRLHRIESAARFQKHRDAGKLTDKVIPELPFLGHGFASSRRWGIEIESGGARGISAPPKWDRKRDGSLRSAWDGFVEVQNFEPFEEEETTTLPWRQCVNQQRHIPHIETYDPLHGDYIYTMREDYLPVQGCEGCGEQTRMVLRTPQTIRHHRQDDDCAEFVSPILTSMHSNGLEAILTEVSKQPQNDSAGVHVHVEASDLSQAELNTLVYGYDMLERFIESSYQRNRRDYCERRNADSVLQAARGVKAGKSVDTGQRYLTLNLQSLSRHGTVEFRAMGPVYDYDYLVRWAMFCREMVNITKAGVTVAEFGRVKKWDDVLSLFVKYGKEFIRAAAFEAGQKVAEVEPLEKPADDNAILATAAYSMVDLSASVAVDYDRMAQAFRDLRINVPRVTLSESWLSSAIANQVSYDATRLASV